MYRLSLAAIRPASSRLSSFAAGAQSRLILIADVGHVVAAFQFYHHWSHQAAFDDTAKQTKALMGWEFGYGIFFSYVFLVLWVSDAAAWWLAGEQYSKRPAWLSVPLHAFLLFIAFNGTVVFKGGIIRAGGIVASLGLLAVVAWRMRIVRATAHSLRDGSSFPETGARYE